MATKSVSYVKSHLAEVIATARADGEPVVITHNGSGTAVLQDLASYERTRRALGLLKLLAMGDEDVRAGRVVAQDALFAALHDRFDPQVPPRRTKR